MGPRPDLGTARLGEASLADDPPLSAFLLNGAGTLGDSERCDQVVLGAVLGDAVATGEHELERLILMQPGTEQKRQASVRHFDGRPAVTDRFLAMQFEKVLDQLRRIGLISQQRSDHLDLLLTRELSVLALFNATQYFTNFHGASYLFERQNEDYFTTFTDKYQLLYTGDMKLYSWNVNGIRAVVNKGAFGKFIEQEQPDIICLQETKAKQGQAEIDLSGYEEYWNSAEKAGYSGTAIFTKIKPLSVINGFADDIAKKYQLADDGYGDPTKEGRVISAEFDAFWVVTVYTPNSKGDLSRLKLRHEQWDPAFLAHLKELEKTKPVLFCGDLNVAHNEIDLANPKPNVGKHGFTNEEREGFDKFEAAGFVDTFRAAYPDKTGAYSWWTHWANARARNIGWRIDYWLASKQIADKISNPQIHPDILGSDHCPVSVTIDI